VDSWKGGLAIRPGGIAKCNVSAWGWVILLTPYYVAKRRENERLETFSRYMAYSLLCREKFPTLPNPDMAYCRAGR